MRHPIENNAHDLYLIANNRIQQTPCIRQIIFPKCSDSIGLNVLFWDQVMWNAHACLERIFQQIFSRSIKILVQFLILKRSLLQCFKRCLELLIDKRNFCNAFVHFLSSPSFSNLRMSAGFHIQTIFSSLSTRILLLCSR